MAPREPRSKSERAIVCAACHRVMWESDWPEHRCSCAKLGQQLALSEELGDAAAEADLIDDVTQGKVGLIDMPEVPCPFCHAKPFEACLSRQGSTMLRMHGSRAALLELRRERA